MCAGNFRLRLCEFVWGVNVLTRDIRKFVATCDRFDSSPVVTLFIQDKEKAGKAGLYGGSASLSGC